MCINGPSGRGPLPAPGVGAANQPEERTDGKMGGDPERSVTVATPVGVPGLVNGRSGRPPALPGRASPGMPQYPGDPVSQAAARDVHTLNSLINRIERTRLQGGPQQGRLPQFATQLLGQMEKIGQTCELLTGGPAAGEPLQAQIAALTELAGTDEDQDGSAVRARQAPALRAGLDGMVNARPEDLDSELGKALDDVVAWTGDVQSRARDRIRYLVQQLASSPLSASSHQQGKAGINQAAERGLDDFLQHTHEEAKQRLLTEARVRFEERSMQLHAAAEKNRGQLLQIMQGSGSIG